MPPRKAKRDHEIKHSTSIGNAGEHLVMAELLSRGFHAFMADRNNRAFDMMVDKNGRHALIRVKTSTSYGAQWTCKKDGKTIFLDMRRRNDFVIIVVLKNIKVEGIQGADYYIVPTHIVDSTLKKCHRHWHKFKRRDGKKRKLTNHRALFFAGNESKSNIAKNFSEKWKKYKNNWDLLHA